MCARCVVGTGVRLAARAAPCPAPKRARVPPRCAGGVARPPPLFPHCRVFVNHAYRTIYLRSPKTGSTALLELLGSCSQLKDPSTRPTCFEVLDVSAQPAVLRSTQSNALGRPPSLATHLLAPATCHTRSPMTPPITRHSGRST